MPIYADATLGVTVFHVQHSSGGTWVNTTALQTNQKYRFRAYFKNFAPSTMDVPMFGGLIHVTDLTVCLIFPGAKFDSSGNHETREPLLGIPDVDGHRNFNDVIKPQASRWASFGSFTWIGPSSPVSQRPVDFSTVHREVRWVPPAPWAKLLPA
jgi:hypothetical protein